MKRNVFRLSVGLLLLPLSWGCSDPTGPEPFCSSNPATAIATFEDANLEAAIRAALGVGAQADLTCDLLSELTDLAAVNGGIVSLVGIQNLSGLTLLDLRHNLFIIDVDPLHGLTNLTLLRLGSNSITDISALSGLTNLGLLTLGSNSITDISALSGLTNLESLGLSENSDLVDISPLSGLTALVDLRLNGNSITDISALNGLTNLESLGLSGNSDLVDIQPLLDNTGLGVGDAVNLQGTDVSCTDIAALATKGVTVSSDCPEL